MDGGRWIARHHPAGGLSFAKVGIVDAVIGNPPYVPITGLDEREKSYYRREYVTARGRCDLYSLFLERSLCWLRPGGRLVFVTPEKYLYVETSRSLRALLSGFSVDELHLIEETTFEGRITYPLITTLDKIPPERATRVTNRAGESHLVSLHGRQDSWLPRLRGQKEIAGHRTLEQVSSSTT